MRLTRLRVVVAVGFVVASVGALGAGAYLARQRLEQTVQRLVTPWGGGGCRSYEVGFGYVRCRDLAVGDFLRVASVDVYPAWSELVHGRVRVDAVLTDATIDVDRVPSKSGSPRGGGTARSVYFDALTVKRGGEPAIAGWHGRADRLSEGWQVSLSGDWRSASVEVDVTRTGAGCVGAVAFRGLRSDALPVALPGGLRIAGTLSGRLELGERWRLSAESDEVRVWVPQLADDPVTAPISVDVTTPAEGCRPVTTPMALTGSGTIAGVPITVWAERSTERTLAGVALDDAPVRALVDLLPRGFLGGERTDALRRAKIEGSVSVTAQATRQGGETTIAPHASVDGLVVEGLIDSAPYARGMFTYAVKDKDGRTTRRTTGDAAPDWVPLRRLPKVLTQAVLASEDASFNYNPGFSVAMALDAFRTNQARGRVLRGGSTLTQQLVKNLLTGPQRTYSRKTFELLVAAQLTRELGKDRILELYLNVVEFGPGIYGVGEASPELFGMPAEQLGPAEALYLAVALPWPTRMYREGWMKHGLGPGEARYVEIRDRLAEIGAVDAAAVGLPRFK